jgi:hypothetical protein
LPDYAPRIADVAVLPNEEMAEEVKAEEVKAVVRFEIGIIESRALYKKVHVMDLLNC